jgi:hypothetical protein
MEQFFESKVSARKQHLTSLHLLLQIPNNADGVRLGWL